MRACRLRGCADFKVEVEVIAAQARPEKMEKKAARSAASPGGGGGGGRGGFESWERPPSPGKLFVGGLAWATDDFALRVRLATIYHSR